MKKSLSRPSCLLLLATVIVNIRSPSPVVHGSRASKWARNINIINESGGPIDYFWINEQTDEASLLAEAVKHGQNQPFNSFSGHVFEFRESPDPDSGLCSGSKDDQFCRANRFTVSEDDVDLQSFRITSNFEVEYFVEEEEEEKEPEKQDEITYVRVPALRVDQKVLPAGPRSLCRDQIQAALERFSGSSTIDASDASRTLSEYAACVEANVTRELLDTSDVLSFQEAARNNVIDYFENYTCSDFSLPSTSPIRNETWTNKGQSYEVGVMHDRPRSKIHTVSNFITEEECQAMEDHARPLLHVASVADGKGGSTVSPNRKAMQAGIKVAWDKEAKGDLIARLSRRVYDYANHATGFNFHENGQEDLMSIQYFGRGANETEPDRYMPHCDGDCNGLPHKFGQRVATMVLYCTLPIKGGATNFRKAGVHVQPTKGSGTFFSYASAEDLIMDEGFTEHSGCPVIEGEKKIVTQWIRLGVDDDNPWDSFDTRKFFLLFVPTY